MKDQYLTKKSTTSLTGNSHLLAMEGLKIREVDEKSIKILIAKIMALTGISDKNLLDPNGLEYYTLESFLRTNKGGYTIKEIEQAFMMMVSGKIPIVENYQKICPLYITKVLDNYIEWRNKSNIKPKPKEKIINVEDENKKERLNQINLFKTMESLENLSIYQAANMYDALEKEGIHIFDVKQKKEVWKKEKEKWLHEAENRMLENKMIKALKNSLGLQIKKVLNTGVNEEIINRSKKILLNKLKKNQND